MSKAVIIIGGGIAGLSSAWELSQRGAKVTILEQGALGQESSWAGAGILSALLPWDYAGPVNQLIDYSLQHYEVWIETLRRHSDIDPEYRKTGMLVLNEPSPMRAEQWLKAHHRSSPAPEELVAKLAAQHAPAFWLPHVAQVRNPRLIQALRAGLKAIGASIHEKQEVTGFKLSSNRISAAITHDQVWPADTFIVTTGAWSAKLLAGITPALPIRPMRGQILLYAANPGTLPCIVYQNHRYLVPRADGLILAGSTIEDSGFNKQTTQAAHHDLHQFATGLIPTLAHAQPIRHWAGLRPGSPDNMPFIAHHPHLSNLYINAGHFRYGVTMAPGSAHLISDLILNDPPGLDMTPYQWPLQ